MVGNPLLEQPITHQFLQTIIPQVIALEVLVMVNNLGAMIVVMEIGFPHLVLFIPQQLTLIILGVILLEKVIVEGIVTLEDIPTLVVAVMILQEIMLEENMEATILLEHTLEGSLIPMIQAQERIPIVEEALLEGIIVGDPILEKVTPMGVIAVVTPQEGLIPVEILEALLADHLAEEILAEEVTPEQGMFL